MLPAGHGRYDLSGQYPAGGLAGVPQGRRGQRTRLSVPDQQFLPQRQPLCQEAGQDGPEDRPQPHHALRRSHLRKDTGAVSGQARLCAGQRISFERFQGIRHRGGSGKSRNRGDRL